MGRFWHGFFCGPPSHKRVAWLGAGAGVAVIALAAVIARNVTPPFALSVFLVGAAEFGWAAELLPRRRVAAAGWARLARWLCAVGGAALAGVCLARGLAPVAWFGVVIAGTGVLLALEMAPEGPANRPAANTGRPRR